MSSGKGEGALNIIYFDPLRSVRIFSVRLEPFSKHCFSNLTPFSMRL